MSGIPDTSMYEALKFLDNLQKFINDFNYVKEWARKVIRSMEEYRDKKMKEMRDKETVEKYFPNKEHHIFENHKKFEHYWHSAKNILDNALTPLIPYDNNEKLKEAKDFQLMFQGLLIYELPHKQSSDEMRAIHCISKWFDEYLLWREKYTIDRITWKGIQGHMNTLKEYMSEILIVKNDSNEMEKDIFRVRMYIEHVELLTRSYAKAVKKYYSIN